MIDHGIGAAMRMALQIFEQASRRTGRTEELLKTLRDGDVVIAATEAAMRHIRHELRQTRPQLDQTVEVTWCSPARSMPQIADFIQRHQRPGRVQRVIFEHTFIDGFWEQSLIEVGKELDVLDGIANRRLKPGEEGHAQPVGDFAGRMDEWERREGVR